MRVGFVLAALVYCLFVRDAQAAPDLPALMLLEGAIVPAEAPPAVVPTSRDRVLAFSVATGELVGTGPVSDAHYVLLLSRTASFNGTPVVLEFQQGRKRYALIREDGSPGSPALLRFLGRTLPERTSLPLRVGQQTAELAASEAADPQAQRLSLRTDLPCSAEADVNHDGVCDEADLRILRLYSGGATRTVGRP